MLVSPSSPRAMKTPPPTASSAKPPITISAATRLATFSAVEHQTVMTIHERMIAERGEDGALPRLRLRDRADVDDRQQDRQDPQRVRRGVADGEEEEDADRAEDQRHHRPLRNDVASETARDRPAPPRNSSAKAA